MFGSVHLCFSYQQFLLDTWLFLFLSVGEILHHEKTILARAVVCQYVLNLLTIQKYEKEQHSLAFCFTLLNFFQNLFFMYAHISTGMLATLAFCAFCYTWTCMCVLSLTHKHSHTTKNKFRCTENLDISVISMAHDRCMIELFLLQHHSPNL
jgi:hypothetical protein